MVVGTGDAECRLPFRVPTGELGGSEGVDALSRPLGTNWSICSWRSPLDDRESANDRASPRSSSTS